MVAFRSYLGMQHQILSRAKTTAASNQAERKRPNFSVKIQLYR